MLLLKYTRSNCNTNYDLDTFGFQNIRNQYCDNCVMYPSFKLFAPSEIASQPISSPSNVVAVWMHLLHSSVAVRCIPVRMLNSLPWVRFNEFIRKPSDLSTMRLLLLSHASSLFGMSTLIQNLLCYFNTTSVGL